jgi:hypothetical protein
MRPSVVRVSVLLGVAALVACSGATNSGSGFGPDGGSGSGGGSGGGSGSGSGGGSGSGSGGSFGPAGPGADGGTAAACAPSPANYDIPGNNCDDDGDGQVDNVITCDATLAANGDATAFAKALGLCQMADATHWGLVSATYTNGHTQTGPGKGNFAQQHGILPKFGAKVKPREGSLLGVLSSGSASETDSDMGPQFKGSKAGMQGLPTGLGGNSGDVPAGFPKAAQACPSTTTTVNDVIDVKLQIKAPANAKGLSFDFDFWSGEWPDYECSDYNDSFIAYLSAPGFNKGTPDNMSFDGNGNPLSVNNNFFQVCTPSVETGCSGNKTGTSVCKLGPDELAGTGFSDPQQAYCSQTSTSGGATSWLTSQAPIGPGDTLTIEFIIWDTGDWQYDSSVLIDNFTWVPNPIQGPVTQPSPPK